VRIIIAWFFKQIFSAQQQNQILKKNTMTTPTTESALEKRMSTIKHKIVVLSGKGGVGKSSM
jgi:Mrp family chromosome partitioning ATPase